MVFVRVKVSLADVLKSFFDFQKGSAVCKKLKFIPTLFAYVLEFVCGTRGGAVG